MKRLAAVFTLALSALTAFAADAPQQPLARYPDDYKPSPCAPTQSCNSFTRSEMSSAAALYLGLPLDPNWVDQHGDEMDALLAPNCRKHATCLATPGNNHLFCDDTMAPEFRTVCDKRFPRSGDPHDSDQCRAYIETFLVGVDQRAIKSWIAAQQCANEKTPAYEHKEPPIVWIDPVSFGPDYKGYITVYAVDAATHVPVQADFDILGQIVYTGNNPTGHLATYYPFNWKVQYDRVADEQTGHTKLVAPKLVVRPDHYPPVTLTMPVTVPALKVSMMPPVEKLRSGKNTITVVASDAATGKPVELRVLMGDTPIGTSNEPIEITLEKGKKRPEIWVTSLFNRYSDVTVAPAQK